MSTCSGEIPGSAHLETQLDESWSWSIMAPIIITTIFPFECKANVVVQLFGARWLVTIHNSTSFPGSMLSLILSFYVGSKWYLVILGACSLSSSPVAVSCMFLLISMRSLIPPWMNISAVVAKTHTSRFWWNLVHRLFRVCRTRWWQSQSAKRPHSRDTDLGGTVLV